MNPLCKAMLDGARPAWSELQSAWERHFPLFREMHSTPQDAIWHGEGNVAIHTGMVLEQARQIIDATPEMTATQRLTLQLGAVFHDIGKPLTTRTREIEGRERIVSPHHATAGRNYLCLRLSALELPPDVESSVLALTALHHQPRRLVQDDASFARWRQLARQVPLPLLYWLEQADLRGRICPDLSEQLETMELFRLRAEELELWETTDPWADWRTAIDAAFAQRPTDFRSHAFAAAVRDAESGVIQSVEEGIARAYQLKDPAPELTLLWGPSGSGKSSWIERHGSGANIVSLDALRQQIAGKREDQSMNGQVLQAAKELLKTHLRGNGRIIFDATKLRRELRAASLQLGFDYGAHVRIIALKNSIPTLQARNQKRPHPVPESVLMRQLEMLEWPDVDEAHKVVVHG